MAPVELKTYRGHKITVDEKGNFTIVVGGEFVKKATIKSMEKYIDGLVDTKIRPKEIMSATPASYIGLMNKPKRHKITALKKTKYSYGDSFSLIEEGGKEYYGGTLHMYDYNDQVFASLENLVNEYKAVQEEFRLRHEQLLNKLTKLSLEDVIEYMTGDASIANSR